MFVPAAGRSGPDDRRTGAQRLADALVDVCSARLPDASGEQPGPVGGTRAQIGVLVSAEVLLGLSELPAQLLGYGPIPADTARRLACNGLFDRLLTDPAGRLVELGRVRRDPSETLRRYLVVRDQHCQFPGCGLPAWRCDPSRDPV